MSMQTPRPGTAGEAACEPRLPERPRLVFYCQSSLGIGHTLRSVRLTDALTRYFDVHFVHGGTAIDALRWPRGIVVTQLPPLVADAEFSGLYTTGPAAVEAVLAQRRERLVAIVERFSPQVLLVEMYPFGRGAFGREIRPMLRAAKRRGAAIVCSLRDILVKKKRQEEYERKVVARLNQDFDLLLVHGDDRVFRLEDTFSRVDEIRIPVHYTGYVSAGSSGISPEVARRGIVTSLGGGRFGHELAQAVVDAMPLITERVGEPVVLYTGPFCPVALQRRWRSQAAETSALRVEAFHPDFPRRLSRAALSISMAGYNTTMDVLAAGVPALLHPAANNGGMDQRLRVQRLAETGAVHVLEKEDLAPCRLVRCIEQVLARRRAGATPVMNLDGARNSVALLARIIGHS